MTDKGSGKCDKKPKKCCKVKCPSVCVKRCADVCYTSYYSSGPNVLQPVQLPSQIDADGEIQNIEYLPLELCGDSCYRLPYNVSDGQQFSFIGGAWTTAFQCATVDSCNFKRDGSAVEILKSGDYNLALALQANVSEAAIMEAGRLIRRYRDLAASASNGVTLADGSYGVRTSLVALPPCSKVAHEIASSVRGYTYRGQDERSVDVEDYLRGAETFPNVDTIVSLCAGTRLIVVISYFNNASLPTSAPEARAASAKSSGGSFTSQSYSVCPAVRPVVVELTLKRLGGITSLKRDCDRS